MRASSNFGVKCKNCNSRFGAMVNSGGTSSCPNCGGELVADSDAKDVITNFVCHHCKTSIGMMVGSETCPSCGRKI